MIQTYQIVNEIDKAKLFAQAQYREKQEVTHIKCRKKRSRLNVRANTFSNRVVDSWNNLPENVVSAPSVKAFKRRLNKHSHNLTQPVTKPANTLENIALRIKKHLYKSDDLLRCRVW